MRARGWVTVTITVTAAVLVAMVAGTAARAATPAPSPMPGGLLPGAMPAAVDDGVHIVKALSGPSCSGYFSQTSAPATIRVLVHGTPIRVVSVPFEQYVEDVLPHEWIPSWGAEALKAGAVAVKSYAWYWVNHYGGYLNTRANCFDVTDDTNFQVYKAGLDDPRTNDAVQQTWNVVARDASHLVLQASYRAALTTHPTTEVCGEAATGSTLSQYGSQACAIAGSNYQDILRRYYTPLELATTSTVAVSAPAHGPVVLASTGVLAAYRLAAPDILGSSQALPGGAFGPWSALNRGPQFAGQPSALTASNGTLAVYALTAARQVFGDGQPRPGAAFTGWKPIGTSSPQLASDPVPLVAASGALVVYATAVDGNVWGTGQSREGHAFGPWLRLTSGGGFSGKPAALVTAAGQIVIYARHGELVEGAGQAVAGGPFSPFRTLGSGTPSAIAAPNVIQANDGTLALFVTGSTGLWEASQPAPGLAFGAWRQLSATIFANASQAHAFSSGTVVAYADSGPDVLGAQALGPSSTFSAFKAIGAGSPQAAGAPAVALAANGAIGLYVIGSDGFLWGTAQAAPGTTFGPWRHVGG